MSGMKYIEAAVGENDASAQPPSLTDPSLQFVPQSDFPTRGIRPMGCGRSDLKVVENFVDGYGLNANFFDLEPTRHIGKLDRGSKIRACGQNHPKDSHDHIACPCDVVDLSWAGWENVSPAIAPNKGHSIPVEGDDSNIQIEVFKKFTARNKCLIVGVKRATHIQSGFEAIWCKAA
jgi:hypothetical protein